jgi:flagellar assembly factor FliW
MIAGLDGSTASARTDPPMHAAAPAPSATDSASDLPAERTIASRVLGEMTLSPEALYTFPEGLHGFPAETEFALVPAGREGFWWLQSTVEAPLAFLLVDPFRVSPGYELDLSVGDEQFLSLRSPDDALVLTVVTLPSDGSASATTNLRGPLVFNTAEQRGRQVVSAQENGYSLHEPVSLQTAEESGS